MSPRVAPLDEHLDDSASVLQPVDVTFPAYRWLIILGWMTAKGMGQDLLDEVGEQIQRQVGTPPDRAPARDYEREWREDQVR